MRTLSASATVAGLQFDITTTGTLALTLGGDFATDSENVGGNTSRVLVWSPSAATFSGSFMTVSKYVAAIENVIGASATGTLVASTITIIGDGIVKSFKLS